jgi:hypothetical protein
MANQTLAELRLELADARADLEGVESERDDLAEQNEILSKQLDQIFEIAAPEGSDDDESDFDGDDGGD